MPGVDYSTDPRATITETTYPTPYNDTPTATTSAEPAPTKLTPKERRQSYLDAFDQQLSGSIPDYVADILTPKQKRRMARRTTKGIAKGVAHMNILRDAYDTYGQPENQLREYYMNLLGGNDYDSMRGLVDYQTGGSDPGMTQITNAGGPGPRTDLERGSVDYQRGGRQSLADLEAYGSRLLSDPAAGFERSAMLGQLSAYAKERLGSGLTDEEYKALMNPQLEGVESQYLEGRRTLGNQVAASGQDPRMAAAMMGSLERGRQQERAGIGRDMVLKQLQRKQEMEQLANQVAGQQLTEEQLRQLRIAQAEGLGLDIGRLGEDVRQFDVRTGEDARRFNVDTAEGMRRFDWEALQREIERQDALREEGRKFNVGFGEEQRQFDVGTGEKARQFDVQNALARQDAIERYLMLLAQQAEGRREYDLGFVDSRRQARLNRELIQKMAKEAEPTDLEQASSILGGIRGGISGG